MENKEKALVLIDSNAIIHRAYHALPKNMSTSKGELTNAVYGFATTLIKVLEDLHPTHIAASFDVGKATERIAQYAEYKAHRVSADQELYDQIPKVYELLEVLDIPVYTCEGHEADDCIGTISSMFELRNGVISNPEGDPLGRSEKSHGTMGSLASLEPPTGGLGMGRDDTEIRREEWKVYIISGDKDIFQLIDGNIFVYWLKKGLSEAGIVNRKVIEIEWGLQPEDFIDLKALAGDPSDNIPGVPGIGPKTATSLLLKYDTLVKLYDRIAEALEAHDIISKSEFLISNQIPNPNDQIIKTVSKELEIKPSALKALVENKEQAFLSQKLATINRNVPIDFKLEDAEFGDYDKGKLKEFFERMQFHSLLKRFGVEKAAEPKTKEAKEQKDKDKQLKLL